MNRRTQIISGAIAVLAVSGIVTVAFLAANGINAAPAPTPTVVVADTTPYGVAAGDYVAQLAAAENARRAAVQAEADRVAAEQAAAAAQAQADADAEQAADQQPAKDGSEQASPVAPVRCPAGSTANSNDGVNDTSCFPDICFSIAVPDPAHPECDVAFRP